VLLLNTEKLKAEKILPDIKLHASVMDIGLIVLVCSAQVLTVCIPNVKEVSFYLLIMQYIQITYRLYASFCLASLFIFYNTYKHPYADAVFCYHAPGPSKHCFRYLSRRLWI